MERIMISEELWQDLNKQSFALAYKYEIIMNLINDLKTKCNDENLNEKYTQIHDLAKSGAKELYEFNNVLIETFDY